MNNNKNLIGINYSEELRQNIINGRKNKNLTIKEASEILNISEEIIKALENGNFEEINNDIFIIGHIKTYLKLINIDPKLLSNNSEVESINLRTEKQNIISPYKFKLSRRLVILISLLLFFLTLIIYQKIGQLKTTNITNTNNNVIINKEITAEEITFPEKQLLDIVTPEPNKEVLDVIDGKQAVTSNNKNDLTEDKKIKFILIEAKEDSWIEIQDKSSKILVSKIIKKNENIKLSYEKDLLLVTGNAGGIIIKINDNIINNIGKSGEVKRNISLNIENLIKFIDK